jgi:hypothetical protein
MGKIVDERDTEGVISVVPFNIRTTPWLDIKMAGVLV